MKNSITEIAQPEKIYLTDMVQITALAELNNDTTIVMKTHSSTDAAYAHHLNNLFDGQVVTERSNVSFPHTC